MKTILDRITEEQMRLMVLRVWQKGLDPFTPAQRQVMFETACQQHLADRKVA